MSRQTDSLIRRIDLPPWTVADFVCPPDIAFDGTGAAYISHNVEPTLWQIDPDTFQLKEHQLRLLKREHLDIGLAKLRFPSDGTFFAGASSGGSQWRIDVRSATAQLVQVAASVKDECGLLPAGAKLLPGHRRDKRSRLRHGQDDLVRLFPRCSAARGSKA